MIKKVLLISLLAFLAASPSFGQIYRGEGEGKNGSVAVALHFVEYAGYRYLLLIEEVSIFLDEENFLHLQAVLEKFGEWEEIAADGHITLTKTIDSITFTSFHFNHTFFRQPLMFYFVFTGGPRKTAAAAEMAIEEPVTDSEDTTAESTGWYTLYIDTTLERIFPFHLSSKTIQDLLEALSPERLALARDAYERQRALEELFN